MTEKIVIFKKTIATAMVFLCLSFHSQADEGEQKSSSNDTKNHNIYLSLAQDHDIPSTQNEDIFDCSDKIFAVVELNSYPIGKYNLAVIWTDPSQTVRERTKYDFHVRGENTRLWAWLSLTRGFGGGMLQWVNPAAGLEEFIGPWTIDININGKKIGQKSFEVSC